MKNCFRLKKQPWFWCFLENMVDDIFQNIFHLQMHQRNLFFKKIIFDISTLKQ
jgi:hypothetical protein